MVLTHFSYIELHNFKYDLNCIFKNQYLIILAFFWCSTNLKAQSIKYDNPAFKHYTSEDGLPSSEVHEAVQDANGYMWFGTDNGLSRFDGYTFKNYGYSDGLLHQVIFGLMIDKHGEIWILTSNGHIYIKDANDNFRPYKYNHLITQYSEKYYKTNFFDFNDDESEIYIALENNGILKIDSFGNQKLIVPDHPGHIAIDSAGIKLHSRYFNETIQTYEMQLELYSKQQTNPITIILDTTRVTFALPYNQNLDGSNYIRINKNIHYFRNGGYFGYTNAERKIKEQLVTAPFSVSHFSSEKLYIGLHRKIGIYVYDSIKDFPEKVAYKLLEGNTISDFYNDCDGGLWILSVDNGIYYMSFDNMQIYTGTSGLPSDNISAFDFVNDTMLTVSLWDYGLVYLNLLTMEVIDIPKSKLPEPYYYFVKYNAYDNSIIGGSRLQIYKDGVWSKMLVPQEYDRPGAKKVSSNEVDSKIAFLGHQILSTYNQKTNEVKIINEYNSNEYVHSANIDSTGILWYGLRNGLYKYEKEKKKKIELNHPILEGRIEAIDFLSNGDIVLGTKGMGVAIWDRKDSILQIDTKQGLSADNIENIYVDSLDQIWVGTLNGLNRIRIKNDDISIKVINEKHGLPGNEITQVRHRYGKVWVATTKGMAVMNDIKENKESVKPIFSHVTCNLSSVNVDSTDHYTYDHNNFTFEYVAINYLADGDIMYRYRSDTNDEWVLTKNTFLNFASLSPSDYHLEIQAQNEDGYWSESLEYRFTISPPFWTTNWFYGLAFLLLGLGGYLYYTNRLEDINEKQKIKDELNNLERSALRAQMNPHFIFNILNSIQSAIMQNDQEFATTLLSKFAKLIRTTLKNARESKITLEEELDYLSSYLFMEKIRFKDKFEYTVTVDPSIDKDEMLIPPMLAQPLVENAIKHGMKNTQTNKGLIDIIFFKTADNLIITVKDNGPGFQEADIQKAHKSLGMKITKERLQLLNKSTDSLQNLTVHNLQDTDGGIIGAEAKIIINLVL